MAGMKNVTFNQLNEMKFDVIEHFGMFKKGEFFIMNTVPPVQYGADCKSYEWYFVDVKTEDELVKLKGFIKDMFGVDLFFSTIKHAVKTVNDLDKQFARTIKAVDYGACNVRVIPISDRFRKAGVMNG